MTTESIKRAKICKRGHYISKAERSPLQQLATQINWVLNFKLHDLLYRDVNAIDLSASSLILIQQRKEITCKLKEALRADADATKEKLLRQKKKDIDA